MDMGATAPVDDRTARLLGPTVSAARQDTTGDTGEETGEETLVFVKGPDTDARSWEAATASDASSERLEETTSSVDSKSGVGRA